MTNIFRNPDALVDAVRAIMMGETNKNDKSDDGDGLDAVQPKAVKKKFTMAILTLRMSIYIRDVKLFLRM